MQNYFRDLQETGCGTDLNVLHEFLDVFCKDRVVRFRIPDWGQRYASDKLQPGVPIRLPFPKICLEFDLSETKDSSIPGMLLLADYEKCIFGALILRDAERAVPWCGSIMLKIDSEKGLQRIDGRRKIIAEYHIEPSAHKDALKPLQTIFTITLSNFLEALACTNVRMTERHPPGSTFVFGQPHQRDAYYELTIDPNPKNYAGTSQGGTHASPREHLRRGHIRHLANGKSVWINAMVVNPGVGGRIDKDYKIKAVH